LLEISSQETGTCGRKTYIESGSMNLFDVMLTENSDDLTVRLVLGRFVVDPKGTVNDGWRSGHFSAMEI
jgi:hypothetical protein